MQRLFARLADCAHRAPTTTFLRRILTLAALLFCLAVCAAPASAQTTITSFTPTSGAVGASVTITGTAFTGATSVTFNATAATFTVVSATSITATVPTGATTGPIAVTDTAGNATSSTNFTVTVPAPTITSFTPTSGAVGASVAINGTNLTGTTVVGFNGHHPTSFMVNGAGTQITTTVPTGATTGKIAVIAPGGEAFSATDFTVTASAPTITSFTPTSGPVGTAVAINGTNLTGTTVVGFNGHHPTSFMVNGAGTQITTTVPTGATTGLIAVIAPGGEAFSSTNFTVTTGSAPTITSFTPTSGAVGASVTITGTNFTGATAVTFSGPASASFTVVSATSITTTVPTGAATGTLSVTTPSGTATSSGTFTVTVPAPTITSFTPTSGPVGTAVAINGTNLTGTTVVGFNGHHPTSFMVNGAGTQITTTVPSGATTGLIAVIAPGGEAFSATDFTVTTTPAAPTNLIATAGNGFVNLSWTAPAGTVTSYSLYRGTTAGGEGGTPIQTGITGTTATDPGLTNGTAYYYTVQAVNSAGGSPNSNEASATPVNRPPTVAMPAAATPNPATGTTTVLTVTGADDLGPGNLTYTWAATGTPPAPVTYSGATNGTNGASTIMATFTKAGAYSLQVTIMDSQGASVASSVNVTVSQTLTSIVVSPASASVATGATQQFAATASDQFGTALITQPTFTWSVSGGGTISSGGLFTAGTSAGGPFPVTAKSGSVSGMASVTVTSSAATLVSVSVDTSPITARTTGTGTVTLSSAPSVDAVVSLTSSDPAVAVPGTVTVPAGQSSATFTYLAQAVTAQTSVTLTATYASVNKTASVVVTPPIDLTAAATGSSKITLYWTGIPTATGYNIYRGTVSGGPYPTKVTATPVATLDPGPGLTNEFMYTDTGLTAGTDYFYIVRGVSGGVENTQSNEASAIPDASAVPWDAANPAAIVALFVAAVQADAFPNIDEGTDDQYPTQAGLMTVVGPDGVMYQGNYSDNSPAVAYPPSSYIDEYSGNIMYADGTSASLSDDSSNQDPSYDDTLTQMSPLVSSVDDMYPFAGNYTGIWREVLSQGGAWGCAGSCLLPNVADSGSFNMTTFTYPYGYVNSKRVSVAGKTYSDSGNIYMGGQVAYTGSSIGVGYPDFALDAGLQAYTNTSATHTSGWIPFISGPKTASGAGGLIRESAAALTIPVSGGAPSGYKVSITTETRMQFLTPAFPHIPDETVILSFGEPIDSVYIGQILVYPIKANTLLAPDEYPYATLVAFVPGWRKTALNNACGNNSFQVKRINSIAETMFNPLALAKALKSTPKRFLGTTQLLPAANGPSELSSASWRMYVDSSEALGAAWGLGGDTNGVVIDFANVPMTWTDDSTITRYSGAYPNSKVGGLGYVTWNDNNAFFWDSDINLQTDAP